MYISNIGLTFRNQEELTEKLYDTATNYTLPILSKCLDATVLEEELFKWQYDFMILSVIIIVCIVLVFICILCDNGK